MRRMMHRDAGAHKSPRILPGISKLGFAGARTTLLNGVGEVPAPDIHRGETICHS
jgi:hypothetical protein